MEKNTMLSKPRPFTTTFFNWKELIVSIIQGLIITVGTLFAYQYAINKNYDEQLTRSIVFTTLIFSNIFLTLVNRSFYYSIFASMKNKNNLVVLIICITIAILGLMLYLKPLSNFFELEPLNLVQLSISISIGFISTSCRLRRSSRVSLRLSIVLMVFLIFAPLSISGKRII